MSTWSKDELRKIAEADDLHISPFREDGANDSPYLSPMINPRARSATVKIMPVMPAREVRRSVAC